MQTEINISTLAKELAKVKYPVINEGNWEARFFSLVKQTEATHIYERELEEKGLGIITVNIDDMDERLEKEQERVRATCTL